MPFILCYTVYQTRERISSHIQTPREREWKYDAHAQRSIFDKLREVWKCGETLPRVFDMSFQWKLNLTKKRTK